MRDDVTAAKVFCRGTVFSCLMDEKTEELRDIFLDATGADEVTESQEESPGSLATEPADAEGRVRELVETMRERYDFESDLPTEDLVALVVAYHDGDDDDAIAADLDVDEDVVLAARLDLHLVRPGDRETPVDHEAVRELYLADAHVNEMAAELNAGPGTVARARDVVAAEVASTRANNRFRDEFAELLTDSDLEGRMAADAHEDGLQEATEDMETDVSF